MSLKTRGENICKLETSDIPSTSTENTTYPTLLPLSSYNLSADPIHRFTRPCLPCVSPPGYKVSFQLAEEAAPHTWPHNAEMIGMVRYLPKRGEAPPRTGSWIGYVKEDGSWDYVFTAFMYT
jgi:hypothetical protein